VDGSKVRCRREVEGEREVVELPLPAVLTITKGAYEPRYASLKGIMAAKKKPLEVKDAAAGPFADPGGVLELPPERSAGRIVGEGPDAVRRSWSGFSAKKRTHSDPDPERIMTNVLAVVEQRDGALRGTAREVVSAAAALAAELGGSAHALVMAMRRGLRRRSSLGSWGAEVVKVAAHDALAGYHPDGYARRGRPGGPGRGLRRRPLRSDGAGEGPGPPGGGRPRRAPRGGHHGALDGEGGTVSLTRPVYAGKAFSRIAVDASPVVASIRPNVFQPVDARSEPETVETVPVTEDPATWPTRVVSFEATGGDVPDVAEASIVVSGDGG
jgi:hypothetical protein